MYDLDVQGLIRDGYLNLENITKDAAWDDAELITSIEHPTRKFVKANLYLKKTYAYGLSIYKWFLLDGGVVVAEGRPAISREEAIRDATTTVANLNKDKYIHSDEETLDILYSQLRDNISNCFDKIRGLIRSMVKDIKQ